MSASVTVAQTNGQVNTKSNGENHIATYSVNAKGYAVGKIETQIQRNGNNFSIESTTKPSGLAAILLGGNVTDRCEFLINTKQTVTGQNYQSSKKGNTEFGGKIDYDHASRKINYATGQRDDMPAGYLLDNCNFYAAIAIADADIIKNQKIHVLDAEDSRYRSYNFASLENATIDSKFGELKTTKLTLVRESNANRTLTFWLSDKFKFSPVQIIEQRKSRKVILKLISYINELSTE